MIRGEVIVTFTIEYEQEYIELMEDLDILDANLDMEVPFKIEEKEKENERSNTSTKTRS